MNAAEQKLDTLADKFVQTFAPPRVRREARLRDARLRVVRAARGVLNCAHNGDANEALDKLSVLEGAMSLLDRLEQSD